ncbi:Activated RNA polymerase II transcriptional coactivator p15 [Holothuria leucospilota]|uniref:Activated RNA polymerase II transcriptional coactivator p15 n=1 Tax=Holothuria leucospilota TaxID=206669 RepID=A0A9Q0YJ55_HOLLE|nr:Activated RNA polymerase II transcriptional coactivator p15 [Holothuria leucospilota]
MFPFVTDLWKGEKGGAEDADEVAFSPGVTYTPKERFQLIQDARRKYNKDIVTESQQSHANEKRNNAFLARLRVNEHRILERFKSELTEEDKSFYGYFEDFIEIGEIMGELPGKVRDPSTKWRYPYEQNDKDDEVRVSIGDDRYVTLSIFNGKLYIHIREFFFNQEGRMLPTLKGIALTPQQWFQPGKIQHVMDEAIEETSNGAKRRPLLSERRSTSQLKWDLSSIDEAGCHPSNSDLNSEDTI